MARVGLVSPWVKYYRQLEALFKYDPNIKIVFDEDNKVINLYVDEPNKAAALSELLPVEKVFGNVTLPINVIPANDAVATKKETLFKALFKNNPIIANIVTIEGIMTNNITYVIFEPDVVQYYTDDLSDAHGICSTLYQEIAKDVFEQKEGVFFCTDLIDENNVITFRAWT